MKGSYNVPSFYTSLKPLDDANDKNNNDSQDRTLDENSPLNLSNNGSSKKVKTPSQHLTTFNEDIVCLDHGKYTPKLRVRGLKSSLPTDILCNTEPS